MMPKSTRKNTPLTSANSTAAAPVAVLVRPRCRDASLAAPSVTIFPPVQPVARPVAPTSTEIPSSGGLNWAAVAQCESGGNPRTNTGNGYYGLYQFSLPTWRAVGGSGLPSDASAAEQTKRAQILYNRSGAGQWPVCGRKL